MTQEFASLDTILDAARQHAVEIDRCGDWPGPDLNALAGAGASRWVIPADAGGDGLSPLELYQRYERIAAASLTLALVLSQRDSAVALINACAGFALRGKLLAALRDNTVFTTVGIAQLTTSRQGGRPALRATPEAGGWRLDGVIPWATGAAQSEFVVAGAATGDGNQLLFLLPTGKTVADPVLAEALGNSSGVKADPPLPLVALRASWTGQVHCNGALIPASLVLRGPEPKVLGNRQYSLPLGQAFLAMGLCRGGLDLIAGHKSPAAARSLGRLDGQLTRLRREVLDLSVPGMEADATIAAPGLRGQCNDLAVRITHAAVALYKGTALLDTHPAQRLAREAMFLLVWSCPDPVIDCTVDVLSGEC
jgi:alkylation response protein AidB-like acyl-CoA dehydrogenase